MTFQTPLALLALGLVPLMLALYALSQRRSRRYAVRFPGAATLARLAPDSRWRRHLPAGLFLIGLAAALVSLARPEATVAVPVERASVMLVTDGSGSMRATDVSPTRLDAARAAARGFLDDVPDELQVGFVGFSDGAHAVVPPASERTEVRTALEALAADGGTATGDALRAALDALPQPEGDGERPPAAIVLLSDGQHTAGADPLEVAREAAAEQVPVFTVALGTPDGVVDAPTGGQLRVPPDPETMREIAAITGGQAFAAEDAGELGAVYDRLGSQIGTRDEQREITAGFAAGALALLAAAVLTSLRRFGRLP